MLGSLTSIFVSFFSVVSIFSVLFTILFDLRFRPAEVVVCTE